MTCAACRTLGPQEYFVNNWVLSETGGQQTSSLGPRTHLGDTGGPGGAQEGPKKVQGKPKGPKRNPGGAQGAQNAPRGSKKVVQGQPREGTVAGGRRQVDNFVGSYTGCSLKSISAIARDECLQLVWCPAIRFSFIVTDAFCFVSNLCRADGANPTCRGGTFLRRFCAYARGR